jgi:hypothetical protein
MRARSPLRVSQASTRLRKNVNYFKVNYLIWIVTVLVVCMLANPSSLFVLSGARQHKNSDARAWELPGFEPAASPRCVRARCRPRAGIAASWAYLFVVRGDAPLVIAGRAVSDREKLLGASGASVAVIFFLTSVGSVLFSAVCIGLAGAASQHARTRAACLRWRVSRGGQATRVHSTPHTQRVRPVLAPHAARLGRFAQAWRCTALCACLTTCSWTK